MFLLNFNDEKTSKRLDTYYSFCQKKIKHYYNLTNHNIPLCQSDLYSLYLMSEHLSYLSSMEMLNSSLHNLLTKIENNSLVFSNPHFCHPLKWNDTSLFYKCFVVSKLDMINLNSCISLARSPKNSKLMLIAPIILFVNLCIFAIPYSVLACLLYLLFLLPLSICLVSYVLSYNYIFNVFFMHTSHIYFDNWWDFYVKRLSRYYKIDEDLQLELITGLELNSNNEYVCNQLSEYSKIQFKIELHTLLNRKF